jgi:hypothetical protein
MPTRQNPTQITERSAVTAPRTRQSAIVLAFDPNRPRAARAVAAPHAGEHPLVEKLKALLLYQPETSRAIRTLDTWITEYLLRETGGHHGA